MRWSNLYTLTWLNTEEPLHSEDGIPLFIYTYKMKVTLLTIQTFGGEERSRGGHWRSPRTPFTDQRRKTQTPPISHISILQLWNLSKEDLTTTLTFPQWNLTTLSTGLIERAYLVGRQFKAVNSLDNKIHIIKTFCHCIDALLSYCITSALNHNFSRWLITRHYRTFFSYLKSAVDWM